ncbi:MAG: GTP pyrophosphokinase family protein [Lachnospiraceae bacterium]|nr:GTP pyrophosphokinase family protein [Lachnospiraceae bacterium]
MEYKVQGSGVEDWETLILLYNSALKEIGTKVDILNDEFQHIHQYNPIEHVKMRVKTSESIVRKLRKKGYEATIQNMQKYVSDIAGVRIICSFTSDIYRIADMIRNQSDLKILETKDYIEAPKESGYKSYHMIVTVPIFLSDSVYDTKVEIQIRTVAMDFWASLEHKMNYKFDTDVPEHIKQELYDCAKMVSDLDERMLKLNEEILQYVQENPE